MMFQDTFIVPAELWLFIIGKRERRIFMTKSSQFLEYMKIHLISLEQDLESNPESINVIDIPGQIHATRHLLSVATDIMNDNIQGKGY